MAELERRLGLVDASGIVIGGIIGSGIFVSPAIVARDAGAPGLALTVWIAAGLLAACGALCYAELGAALPETGGTYAYLRRAYRTPAVAFLFGWGVFWASFTGSIAAVATVFAQYARVLLEGVIPYGPWTVKVTAVGCIAVLTLINYVSVRTAGRVNTVATGLKVVALLGVIVTGLGFGTVERSHLLPFAPAGPPLSTLAGFGLAMMPALFAYNGWSYSSYVGGEMRDARRTLPLSIGIGLGICIVIYVLVNLSYLAALPFGRLVGSERVAADAMVTLVGPNGAALISIGILVSTFGAANTVLLSCSRTYFAMARDGFFFPALERIHPRFGTPGNAILAQGTVACLMALSGTFEQILIYVTAIDYIFYVLVAIALIRLRRREPDLVRPYRVWGYPWTPLAFIGAGTALVLSTFVQRPIESAVGLLLIGSGLPFYSYWRRRNDSSCPPST